MNGKGDRNHTTDYDAYKRNYLNIRWKDGMALNPLETQCCHSVDTIAPIQGRDAYTVTCTCGEQREVEGTVMKEIAAEAKEALARQRKKENL